MLFLLSVNNKFTIFAPSKRYVMEVITRKYYADIVDSSDPAR